MTNQKCPRTGIPSRVCTCSLHQRIGGQLDANAYASLAQRHRPADLRDAVAELARQGLRAADISRLLQLSEPAVTALLQRAHTQPGAIRGDEAAEIHAQAWQGKPTEFGPLTRAASSVLMQTDDEQPTPAGVAGKGSR